MTQKIKKLEVDLSINLWLNEAMKTQTITPLERAISLAGGVKNIAKACRVSVVAVYKWRKKGHPPVERCPAIEKEVNGQVTRFDLLPPGVRLEKAQAERIAVSPDGRPSAPPSSPSPQPDTEAASHRQIQT